MTRIVRLAPAILFITALSSVSAQRPEGGSPPQFKASVKTKNGSDGTRSTGTMYFSGAKIRTELTTDGESSIMLVDPAARSQYMLIPSEKVYMQMPIGQGPGSGPIPRPSDPMNPCAAGSGNTDCERGSNESVNGHTAIRWDYTNSDGVRTRAWISPRLRFAVKTQDDDGNSTELSDITEGAQAATLFSIPAGYTKMDVGAMGGAGAGRAGRGNGRGKANDPIAAMMANLPPEQQAAMAAAMRGEGPKSPTGTAGSGWEKTKGWVINLTVNGTASSATENDMTGKRQETYTMKIVGAIPLNVLGGASGVPGAPGPSWQLMYTDAIGSPEVLATLATFNAEVSGRIENSYKGTFQSYCDAAARSSAAGLGIGDPSTSVGIVKGDAQIRIPITKRNLDAGAEGNFRISSDLKTYDLFAGFVTKAKETTETRTDTKSCKDGKVTTTNDTRTAAPEYSVQFDLKGLTLPSAVGPVSGSKKMPVKVGEHQFDATVNWTIAPIR